SYQDEAIMGRSFPLKAYSHSDNRNLSWTVKLFASNQQQLDSNVAFLRAIQSCTYPRTQSQNVQVTPYLPPPILTIFCGAVFANDILCAVLRSYNVRFPTDVPWLDTPKQEFPYRLDIELSFDVVYTTADLPGQEKILSDGV